MKTFKGDRILKVMNFSKISSRLKDKLNQGADKVLSTKVKEELGLNKPTIDSLYSLSANDDIEDNLNNFYKPMNSTFLSQRQYKKIRNGGIVLIVVVSVLLFALLIAMIIPSKSYKNKLSQGETFVKGSNITKAKVVEASLKDVEAQSQDSQIEIKDIKVASKELADSFANSSPLLKNPDLELSKYKIRSGDTLETIALKFYGSALPEKINRIKTANKIRNVRLLRIGQEILIPMG